MSKLNNWVMGKYVALQARKVEAEEGQGLAEYGLILALIAVICAAALVTLQGAITGTLSSVASKM